jgi:hypothetical protein
MASPPEVSTSNVDVPVYWRIPLDVLQGSNWSVFGVVGALLLGLLGSRVQDSLGTPTAQILAGVGVGVGSVLLPRLVTGTFFPLRWTLAWVLLACGVGVALTFQMEPRLGWPYFRWALCGGGFGLLIGTMGEPIRRAKGGEEGDLLHLAGLCGHHFLLPWFAVSYGVAKITAAINPRRSGTILTTAIAGALAGLGWGFLLHYVSGKGPRRVFGYSWAVPLLGAFLGALGGGWGGGTAWGIPRQRIQQAQENFPDEETHP